MHFTNESVIAQWLTPNISKFDIKDASENICPRGSLMFLVLWEDIGIQSSIDAP